MSSVEQRGAVADGVDAIELRLDRRDAGRFDGRLVHAGGVEVADLLLRASRRGVGHGRILLEDLVEDFAIALGQLFETAVARVLRRQRMRVTPLADRETIEVVARFDARVHGGEVEAVRREKRRSGRGAAAVDGAAVCDDPHPMTSAVRTMTAAMKVRRMFVPPMGSKVLRRDRSQGTENVT